MTNSIIGPHVENIESLLNPRLALYAMNAGDGPRSYVQNSSYQRGVVDVAKPIIEEEIATKLDVPTIPNGVICIADFGCSTGHNSFPAMQLITQAINRNLMEIESCVIPEFHAFFNDVVTNDFNTLFGSLPPDRLYHAVGVPGDFHGRLLPRSSLHFAYSSWSLQWLTEAPKAVANKGRIFYAKDRKEVSDAYLDKYSRDIETFLKSRAIEMVPGGLMALLVPGEPELWDPETEYTIPSDLNLLGSCLMDMAKKGRFSEGKVDSFNLPFYFPTPRQLKSILEKSQISFTIERMEILNNPGKYTLLSVKARATFFRAVHERLLTHHFGSEIIDELFKLYMRKLAASPVFINPKNDKSIVILAVLKRNED
ncbi:probable S-adenosylmethionine-dependent methyltransferase at5g38100 [Phtheirospermum japonicum]|uniref:Probable S-adenosylmethionine-dependent methyltransferase at5g38100 n=1 Tax=Phtheirospermum japonicum TaxID=374723 RepID=A0A830D2S7_9LAMI|nr:probable S-adenosylmethionine-dependent methyltransferase at5g38100 [Phtheirospermum japonicum]